MLHRLNQNQPNKNLLTAVPVLKLCIMIAVSVWWSDSMGSVAESLEQQEGHCLDHSMSKECLSRNFCRPAVCCALTSGISY